MVDTLESVSCHTAPSQEVDPSNQVNTMMYHPPTITTVDAAKLAQQSFVLRMWN
jgi:hypothetical protein